ncbi:potassium channel family protein [uncultured Shimia sp.]|uniref:potassium channel family protein n=1 Tax=uncultured Shimia sp. TaxID=573152 RepID=UPI002605D39C|nr:potassium channel family protein [uncultured Shimia sp.]
MSGFKTAINDLYTGPSKRSIWFRYLLFAFDIVTISYFIVVTIYPTNETIRSINAVIAMVILLDFLARLWIAPDKRAHLSRIYVWADAIVLFAIFLNQFVPVDLSFLRILRGLRLAHSFYLLQDLRASSSFFRLREDAIVASLNLLVFVFTTTSAVYTLFAKVESGIEGYVDSLYFTVTTLTTTGYGDITPTSITGKVAAVMIMVVGVSLFVHLARTIVMPSKVRHLCKTCGLERHDADAVHCKHCGAVVHIETGGAT